MGPGRNLRYPRDATFEEIVGRPPVAESRVYRHHGGSPLWPTNIEGTAFTTYAFTNGTWNPSSPVVALGEAVWVLEPPTLPVPQIVGGQMQFAIRTATFATLDLEYSEALDGTSPWLPLAHVVGSGNTTNVMDTNAINGATQRFYRLKLIPGLP